MKTKSGPVAPVSRSAPCCLALACLFRGRKELVDPGLPQRLFAPSDGSRLRAVEIETNRQADLAAHHDGQKVCDARRRLVEPNEELLVFLLDDAVDDPREPRRAVRCLHTLSLGRSLEAERLEEPMPDGGLVLRAHGHEGDDLAGLSTELSEVDVEDAEERGPALLDGLVLIVPIVGAREPAVHDANPTHAARLGLD